MSRGELILEIKANLAIIRICNPAARNAMSAQMMEMLDPIVEEISSSSVNFVLLTGDEVAFCAGGDLKDVRTDLMEPGRGAIMCEYMTACLNRLASLPKLLIAAVEGPALGGGAELLTAMDFVVCAEGANIGFVHAALGVSPGWGGGARLLKKMGIKNTIKSLVFAKKMTPEHALKLGLVDEIVPKGKAESRALEIVSNLSKHPKTSIEGVLRLVRNPELEAKVFQELWGAKEHRRALGIQ